MVAGKPSVDPERSSMSESVQTGTITTHVPARLDPLPWARFHWRVVVGLGGVWILDGLSYDGRQRVVPMYSEGQRHRAQPRADRRCRGDLHRRGLLRRIVLRSPDRPLSGWRNLFMLTLAVYLIATVATAFACAWAFLRHTVFHRLRDWGRIRRD